MYTIMILGIFEIFFRLVYVKKQCPSPFNVCSSLQKYLIRIHFYTFRVVCFVVSLINPEVVILSRFCGIVTEDKL